MENTNELDWMLEKAKENTMEIYHDFDTRFRVWTEQILKNRLNVIIQTGGNPEYIERMTTLTLDDYDRLIKRSRTEFTINKDIGQYHDRNCKLFIVTKETIRLYEEQKND